MIQFKNAYSVKPHEIEPNDHFCYVVVAIIGYGGDWAAYRGLADWSPQEVVERGDKISKEAAEALFPTLAVDRVYRR